MALRAAIDVGGTFTDLCALDESTGKFLFVKDSTTPSNFADGVVKVIRRSGLEGKKIDRFIGTGSTMVINALTERKGAKTLLLTTKGFRDVLEIQRSNRKDIYNFLYEKPHPFVPRRLRCEVDERVGYDGRIIRKLDTSDLERAVDLCKAEAVEVVAVALYNAYANPAHETECERFLAERLDGVHVTMSHELTREWREYERTNTTVMNAFVQPKVDLYLRTLEKEMRRLGIRTKLHVMQSNGGVSTFENARRTPIYQVESGPIGGVIGSTILGKAVGTSNLVTLDVGGTTAKTSLIDSGKIKINTQYNIGQHEFSAGYPVKIPVVDIAEIGAGGGSLIWVDEVGSLRAGPTSAGADPGPACYNRGGFEPTITDAFVLTGVIDPDYFLGGEIKLSPELSSAAYEKVAAELGKSIPNAALGAIRLATANMVNAIKLVSVRRGYDPREFAIVAFGGGGPMFATSIAQELGIRQVIIPRVPGVFSAWGMLMTDLRHDYIQTKVTPLQKDRLRELQAILDEIGERAFAQLTEEGVAEGDIRFDVLFDIRYYGQEHTVSTPVPTKIVDEGKTLMMIENRFRGLHEKQYMFTLQDPLEVVNVHLSAFGRIKKPKMVPWRPTDESDSSRRESRRVALLNGSGRTTVTVHERDSLAVNAKVTGPAIIEEPASTTILQKGNKMKVDVYGNLVIEV